MRTEVLMILAGLAVMPLAAQDVTMPAASTKPLSEKIAPAETAEEIVVTASRHEAAAGETACVVDVISGDDIATGRMVRTVPEALADNPAVLVQKTAVGQGSPFLRGFTGFRTLFLIDGIRLNNSVFRDGPNQYWNTVDPLTIDRMEVVFGPGSVLYGSDAVGGTVNAITKDYKPAGGGFTLEESVFARYGSADNSGVARFEIGGGSADIFAFSAGASFKNFDDLTGGRETGLQEATGYREMDFDLKASYCFGADADLVVAYQDVDQDDAWRTHKTIYGLTWMDTTHGTEKERSLWQDRDLTYVKYNARNLGTFAEQVAVCLSYQQQIEMQYRVRSDDRSDRQGFDVRTLGLTAQLASTTSAGLFTYGIEFYGDTVDSYKKNWDAAGVFTGADIQGPVADDATYDTTGLYIQDEIAVTDSMDLTVGLRYTMVAVSAEQVEDPDTGLPVSIEDDYSGVVGSVRLLVKHRPRLNSFYSIAQGFRAPNLSDLTRLDTARSNEIETPSPDLEPEYFTTLEAGVRMGGAAWRTTAAVYYTDIRDMIVRYPTGDMIGTDYEVQKANASEGYIQGAELQGDWHFSDKWTLFGAFAIQYGRATAFPTSFPDEEWDYMTRMLPTTGILGIRWTDRAERYTVETAVAMADRQDLLSGQDKSDTDRIPPDGTPGYAVVDLRGTFRLRDDLTLGLEVGNIGNVDYRIHGSGSNEPGTNVVVSAKMTF